MAAPPLDGLAFRISKMRRQHKRPLRVAKRLNLPDKGWGLIRDLRTLGHPRWPQKENKKPEQQGAGLARALTAADKRARASAAKRGKVWVRGHNRDIPLRKRPLSARRRAPPPQPAEPPLSARRREVPLSARRRPRPLSARRINPLVQRGGAVSAAAQVANRANDPAVQAWLQRNPGRPHTRSFDVKDKNGKWKTVTVNETY